jgi:LSD1 subclass zinc finger protein
MTQPFKCPSCGGPLEYAGGNMAVRCEFCSNQVVVPEELREQHAHGAVQLPEQFERLAEIGRLIRGGNIIAAIKAYREAFGVGLKEAKDAVENLAAGKPVEVSRTVEMSGFQHQSTTLPYSSLPPAHGAGRSKGCSPLAIAVVIFALIISGAAVGIYLNTSRGLRL